VSLGLEEIPDVADDSSGRAVEVNEEEERVVVCDGVRNPLPLSFPEIADGEAENSLRAIATAVLDDVVVVVFLDAGKAEVLEIAPVADVLKTTADVLVTNEDTGVLAIADEATCVPVVEVAEAPAAFGWALIAAADVVVEVVLGVAAGSVAKLAGKVVADRGTAVHCRPSIVVRENPAGRDMMRMKGDTSRRKEYTDQQQSLKYTDPKGSQAINSRNPP
jgi:hypothetical protein